MDATSKLRAAIAIRQERGLWADLRIVNHGAEPASIHNPGVHRPTAGWEFSREAYDVAVLLSFHFLDMTLTTADGMPFERRGIATRADHDVEPAVELKPDDGLTIPIPLHEFFDLEGGVAYSLALTYGDDQARVHAGVEFVVHGP
jgi:hypothetical protein